LSTLRGLVRERDAEAARLALAALQLLAKLRFPLLAPKLRVRRNRFIVRPETEQFAQWLSGMDAQSAAFWLSSAYASLVSQETRQDRALFFTPPELSERVIRNLESAGADFTTARCIDPASGGAAFLAPLARHIRQRLVERRFKPGKILKHIASHLTGWDIDPVLCRLSRAFVWMAVYEDIEATGLIPQLEIDTRDAVRRSVHANCEYDVVVCNPPYRKVSAPELLNLGADHRATSSGQPNLYAIFMGLTLSLAKPTGHLALLTPTSFLSGQYFAPIRRRLASTAHIRQVDLVERRQGVFVGVEQETAVTVLERQGKGNLAVPQTTVFAIGSERAAEFVGVTVVPSNGAPWVLPRAKGDVSLLSLFGRRNHTLASYGYTTRVGLFVPHRDQRRTSKAKGKQRRAFPLIWSTDIGQDGRFEFGQNEHRQRFVVIAKRDDKVVHRCSAVALQRTTAKDDSRRLVAAPISAAFVQRHGGYVGENHVILLLKGERAVCDENLLAAILRSHTVDRLFRCISGSVAVSATELAQLPLPDPQVVMDALRRKDPLEFAVVEGYGLAQRPRETAAVSHLTVETIPAV